MLCIMLAYLMLFDALSNAVCLYDLNIEYHPPRHHRSSRGVKRKKQNLHSFIEK